MGRSVKPDLCLALEQLWTKHQLYLLVAFTGACMTSCVTFSVLGVASSLMSYNDDCVARIDGEDSVIPSAPFQIFFNDDRIQ